jgi:hypothetical protein
MRNLCSGRLVPGAPRFEVVQVQQRRSLYERWRSKPSNASASAKRRSIASCASILRTTTREVRRPPKNELHLRHAIAKHHSLNQRVHFLQRGLLGCHFPTKGPHFGPQGVDFIGLTAPQHHRAPPSLTLRSSDCYNNAASQGHGYG